MEGNINLKSMIFPNNKREQIRKIPMNLKPGGNQGLYNSKLINEEVIDFEKETDLLGEDLMKQWNLNMRNEQYLKSEDFQPFPSTKAYTRIINFTIHNKSENMSELPSHEFNFINNFFVYISNMPKMMTERKLKDIASNYGQIMNERAEISYLNKNEAVRAVECFNGREIFGKKLVASFSDKSDEDKKDYTNNNLSANKGKLKLSFNLSPREDIWNRIKLKK